MRSAEVSSFPAVERLFAHDPFDLSAVARTFQFEAFRECFHHHHEHCPEYRNLCRHVGFHPGNLRGPDDLDRVPFVFVGVLKERDLLSVPREAVYRTFTSSGTGGRMSRIYLDRGSFDRVVKSAWNIHDRLGMVDPTQQVSYLCFSYDPRKASDLGTSFTDDLLTGFTAKREVFFTFQFDEAKGEFYFDLEGSRRRLEEWSRRGGPVRLLGFPAFMFKLLSEWGPSRGRPLNLGPSSWVMTGGGWKTLADQAVTKPEFVARMAEWLGIPRENVRDMYGMVEHGIPYVDCAHHRLHVPLYARVLVRDPATMKVLAPGREGLLQFQTPYLTSYPSHSLLTTDLGRVDPRCDCGLPGAVLTLLGRGGLKKHKGCALTAADAMLRG